MKAVSEPASLIGKAFVKLPSRAAGKILPEAVQVELTGEVSLKFHPMIGGICIRPDVTDPEQVIQLSARATPTFEGPKLILQLIQAGAV